MGGRCVLCGDEDPAFESAPAASTSPLEALEAARVEAAAALEALREAAAEDLQVELGRIATAAEAEAAEARALLSDFRGTVVAYWERHRVERQLPSDSLEATLAAHRERSMLGEIDFAISSVGSNVEGARFAGPALTPSSTPTTPASKPAGRPSKSSTASTSPTTTTAPWRPSVL